jgi:hypothetical protein
MDNKLVPTKQAMNLNNSIFVEKTMPLAGIADTP